ncbi:MAG: reverse transcriptase N-terminal domain-containing protein [Cyanobacteriota bacterium]|nr:reverse transcriptase N-terminal domain-containing protein [Cyanobacteriota bacterium]
MFKLQKRIYRASTDGDFKLVHKLQKMMISSWYAKGLPENRIFIRKNNNHSQRGRRGQ